MPRRTARQARTLGLWTASWLFVLLVAGLLRLGDLSVQWPVLAVPVLWALVALRPRRRRDLVRRPEPDRRYREERYPRDAARRPDPEDRYADERYPDERYVDERYSDERYVDERYIDERYVDDRYPDDRYPRDDARGRPTPERPTPREVPPTRELRWDELPPLREAPRRRRDRREG